MKKLTTITIVITIIAVLFLASPASAATASASVQKRAKAENSALVDCARAHGWLVTTNKVTSQTKDKLKIKVIFKNSKYQLKLVQTTWKTSSRLRTVFKSGKTKYSSVAIQACLKKYAIAGDVATVLQDRVEILMDDIVDVAVENGWTAKTTTSVKDGAAICTVEVRNSKYTFTAAVQAAVKGDKVEISWQRRGTASTKEAILDWLVQYKVADVATPDPDEPGTV